MIRKSQMQAQMQHEMQMMQEIRRSQTARKSNMKQMQMMNLLGAQQQQQQRGARAMSSVREEDEQYNYDDVEMGGFMNSNGNCNQINVKPSPTGRRLPPRCVSGLDTTQDMGTFTNSTSTNSGNLQCGRPIRVTVTEPQTTIGQRGRARSNGPASARPNGGASRKFR